MPSAGFSPNTEAAFHLFSPRGTAMGGPDGGLDPNMYTFPDNNEHLHHHNGGAHSHHSTLGSLPEESAEHTQGNDKGSSSSSQNGVQPHYTLDAYSGNNEHNMGVDSGMLSSLPSNITNSNADGVPRNISTSPMVRFATHDGSQHLAGHNSMHPFGQVPLLQAPPHPHHHDMYSHSTTPEAVA